MTVKRSYGWKKQPPDPRDWVVGLDVDSSALPDSCDLRAGMPPVWDQGSTNSCTSHAAGAAFEYALARQKLQDFMPSRLFLYYNERLLEGTPDQDSGATIRDSVKALATYGTLPESYWPFTSDVFKAPDAIDYTMALNNVVTSYSSVPQIEAAVNASIYAFKPVIFGFMVYESFESDEVAKTGIMPMPDPSEQMLGGHAVLAVGWSKQRKAHLIRNSWGPDWGIGGYFWMPDSFFFDPQYTADLWVINTEK